MFGYLRTSWTMRVDLVCDYICRLLNHMDEQGVSVCTPTLREQELIARTDWFIQLRWVVVASGPLSV